MFKFFKEKLQNIFKGKEEEKVVEEKLDKKEKKVKEKQVKADKKQKKAKELEKVEVKKEIEKEEIIEEQKAQLEEAIEELEEKVEDKYEKSLEEPEVKKEKQSFFSRLQSKISSSVNTVRIDKKTFDEFFEKLEFLLLENNVALEVVDKIRDDMEKSLVNIEVKKDKLEEEVKNSLKEAIYSILIEPEDIIEKISKKSGVFIILFFGINGAGKTTTIAKFAHMLKQHKISSVLAAADTFRAASIEQLKKHGENLDINVIHHTYGSDPAAVAFDAIKHAQAHDIKVVLIDTAGRMHTKDNLLKEMEKIVRVTKPDMKIFVAEAITGNDATEQAKAFNASVELDGTILTKADVDERGGSAISIGYVTKKPILFLGTGQEYKDLDKFSPKEILVNLGLE